MSWAPLILSLEIAALAMIIALVFGTALALLLDWQRCPGRHFLDAVVCAPLVMPPTVLGYYLLTVIGNNSAIGRAWHSVTGGTLVFSFTAAVIAGAAGSLPLVVRSVRIGLQSVDSDLIAAARTLGAGPARVLVTVTLRLAGPALFAGAALAFARALGDYGATMMVAGGKIDGVPTASIHVMDLVTASRDDEARQMSLVTTAVGVGLLYLSNRLLLRLHPPRG
ncbi:MAG: molybdate ABC transporter permease subunit [Kofleriaceae bacterium]